MKTLLVGLGRNLLGRERYLRLRIEHRRAARRILGHARCKLGFPLRLATAPLRTLPDFLIIGAQKAGTSSLFDYFNQHSHVRAPLQKEPQYFTNGLSLLPPRSLLWYRAHFPLNRQMKEAGKTYYTGEASPSYLLHPLAAARVARVLPAARIIILLRNPVARAYSHYHHNYAKGNESRSFLDAIQDEIASLESLIPRLSSNRFQETARYLYLTRGCYAWQVQHWLDHFPRSQILILPSERLFQNPKGVFAEALTFLGMPEGNLASVVYQVRRKGQYTEPMQADTCEFLTRYFRPHNERLAELLGMDFGWD